MNYKIIQDEEALKGFIKWLPELKKGEVFYFSLFSRKKYAPNSNLKSDKSCLKRFCATKKEYIIGKIRQLECAEGSFTTDTGEPVPIESLALYVMPNPRSLEKATKNALIKFAHLITEPYNGYNPSSEILSIIQTSCGEKHFYDFDFDNVEIDTVMTQLEGKTNLNCLTLIQTRGGFHLLVKLANIESQHKKSWYNAISSISGADCRGDQLLPCVGAAQGNFMPIFV